MPSGVRQIEMTWRCSSCEHENLGRHKTCQQCGNPKDASEKYEMPADTAAAPSVTDPGLVKLATAGPNWRCAYCGSDQRRADDTCAECGASAAEGTDARPAPARAAAAPAPPPRRRRWPKILAGAAVAIAAVVAWSQWPRTYDASVAGARWQHTIAVERYQIWDREGWRSDAPAAAFDVRSLGQRVHHYDDVLDGYDTEHYTVQVPCGEDCYDVPETCRESCSDNGNGFATCRTTCSGGGRRCSTKYCAEGRTRQVPRYRKEPRYAEAVRYRVWDWGPHRQVVADGAGTGDMRWPVEEAHVGQGLAAREQEREQRSARYLVTLGYDGDRRLSFEVATAEAFARFAPGSKHALRIQGNNVSVDGAPVARLFATR